MSSKDSRLKTLFAYYKTQEEDAANNAIADLHDHAGRGDIEEVKKALWRPAKAAELVRTVDEITGNVLLHAVAGGFNSALVALVLQHGPECANVRNNKGLLPIEKALFRRPASLSEQKIHRETLEMLCEASNSSKMNEGVPHATVGDGPGWWLKNTLRFAMYNGQSENVLDMLERYGACPDIDGRCGEADELQRVSLFSVLASQDALGFAFSRQSTVLSRYPAIAEIESCTLGECAASWQRFRHRLPPPNQMRLWASHYNCFQSARLTNALLNCTDLSLQTSSHAEFLVCASTVEHGTTEGLDEHEALGARPDAKKRGFLMLELGFTGHRCNDVEHYEIRKSDLDRLQAPALFAIAV